MADEGGIDSTLAVELFFKRKDDQRFVDVLAEEADSPLAPRPELRSHVVDHGNAALLHLPGHAPVEGRRVDHDGEAGFPLVGFGDQMPVPAIDLWQVAEDFGDANDGEVFRIDYGVAARGAHALSADTEEIELRVEAVQGFDELRAVHFPRSFAG
jgi:hypothetical protein